ncbi:hypothetical protein QOT17_003597 [Balamuthia mandrillaris]
MGTSFSYLSFRETVYVIGLCVLVGFNLALVLVSFLGLSLYRLYFSRFSFSFFDGGGLFLLRCHRRASPQPNSALPSKSLHLGEEEGSSRAKDEDGWVDEDEEPEGEGVPLLHSDQANMQERAREEESCGLRYQTERKAQQRRINMVRRIVVNLAFWWTVITLGGFLIFSVTMDYVPLWLGLVGATLFYWSLWFIAFPFDGFSSSSSSSSTSSSSASTHASSSCSSGSSSQHSSTFKKQTEDMSQQGSHEEEGEEEDQLCCGTRLELLGKNHQRSSDAPQRRHKRTRGRQLVNHLCGERLVSACLDSRLGRALARRCRKISFFSEGLCVAEYPFHLSTRFTRRISGETTCDKTTASSPPCHVYLTLGDTATTVIVHFHTAVLPADSVPVVYYDVVSHSGASANKSLVTQYRYMAQATSFDFSTRDMKRTLHWAELKQLSPDTIYYFRAGHGDNTRVFSRELSFLTGVAQNSSQDFHLVAGGDTGTSVFYEMMSNVAAALRPRFALVGGDFAYSNAMLTCYRAWDHWFDIWERTMVTPQGHTIPLVPAIGNHETGAISTNIHSKDEVPFFFHYLTQYKPSESFAPLHRPKKDESYRRVYLGGNVMLLVLDSGMYADVGGHQTRWIEETLRAERNRTLESGAHPTTIIALYHVPMWPADNGKSNVVEEMQKKWGPLFDRYTVSVALENHSHRYGRKKFMLNREGTHNETLFIGGGAWGVPPSNNHCNLHWFFDWCSTGTPSYTARMEVKRHVLHIHIFPSNNTTQGHATIDAVDIDGVVFDSVEIPLP